MTILSRYDVVLLSLRDDNAVQCVIALCAYWEILLEPSATLLRSSIGISGESIM